MTGRGSVTPERAWVLLQLAESSQYQGNDGYRDKLGSRYRWDSTVPNHAKLREGDVIVLRDSERVLGIGTVDELAVDPHATKLRRRCPACGSTAFKRRTTLAPPYRCGRCESVFATPREETIDVTRYTAAYEPSWRGGSQGLTPSGA